jgi:enterochelin esterase-like enzyme
VIGALALILLAGPSDWASPVRPVVAPPAEADLRRMLGVAKTKVVVRKNLLTFVAQGTESPLRPPSFMPEMQRLAGTDLWFSQANYDHWDRSFFSYTVVDGEKMKIESFFGARAPKRPKPSVTLTGTITTHKIASKYLDEEREVTVYMPKSSRPNMPVVYAADNTAEAYGRLVDSLIAQGKVSPFAIVGIQPGGYRGKPGTDYDFDLDFRAKEYLKQFDPERYAKHLDFVEKEVMPWAESKFGLSNRRENRVLTGFSNGGAFALTASVDRPHLFGTVMAFSIAAYDQDSFKIAVQNKTLPRYEIAAGKLEPFIRGSEAARTTLEAANAKVRFTAFESGHEWEMWCIAFIESIRRCFPPG